VAVDQPSITGFDNGIGTVDAHGCKHIVYIVGAGRIRIISLMSSHTSNINPNELVLALDKRDWVLLNMDRASMRIHS
jgi:hypothetical protein